MPALSNSRRRFNQGVFAAAASILVAPRIGRAADKPITIVVGYPPGGSTDVFARLMAASLQDVMNRNVIVRNQPGASGQIAASVALRDGTDGSAILAINQPDLSLIVARGDAKFKLSDFRIALVDMREPRVFLVRKDSGIASFAQFVEKARKAPGKLSISVTGGSAQECMARWLIDALKLDVIVVNYKGGTEAAQALLAGDVTANVGDDFVRSSLSDRVACLFLGTDSGSPRWPAAPSMSSVLAPYNVALPSPSFLARYGVYAVSAEWAQRDAAGYQFLQKSLLQARQAPAFRDYIAKNHVEDLSVGQPGEAYEKTFAAEMAQLSRVVSLK